MNDSRRILTVFGEVVRSGPLHKQIGAQEISIALGQLLDATPEGAPPDLQPLYDFLISRDVDQAHVDEAFVVFAGKAAEFGFRYREPSQVAGLDDDSRDEFVEMSRERKVVMRREKPPEQSAARPIPAPKGPKAKDGSPRVLLAVLGVVALLVLGFFVYLQVTAVPPSRDLVVSDPAALPCQNLKGNPPTLVCTIQKNAFEAEPRDSMKSRGKITLQLAGAEYTRVLLVTPTGEILTSF